MDKFTFKKPDMHRPKTSITGSISIYKDVVQKFDGYHKLMRKNFTYKHTTFNLTYYQCSEHQSKIFSQNFTN